MRGHHSDDDRAYPHHPREYEAGARAEGRARQWRLLSTNARKEEERDREIVRERLRRREQALARLESSKTASSGGPPHCNEDDGDHMIRDTTSQGGCESCVRLGRQCQSCFGMAAFESSYRRHFGNAPDPVPSWDSCAQPYARRRPTAGISYRGIVSPNLRRLHDRETEAVLGRTQEIRLRALNEANRLRRTVGGADAKLHAQNVMMDNGFLPDQGAVGSDGVVMAGVRGSGGERRVTNM